MFWAKLAAVCIKLFARNGDRAVDVLRANDCTEVVDRADFDNITDAIVWASPLGAANRVSVRSQDTRRAIRTA